jgi:hypothetical protein
MLNIFSAISTTMPESGNVIQLDLQEMAVTFKAGFSPAQIFPSSWIMAENRCKVSSQRRL